MLCLGFQILKEKKGQANKTKKETTKNTQLDWWDRRQPDLIQKTGLEDGTVRQKTTRLSSLLLQVVGEPLVYKPQHFFFKQKKDIFKKRRYPPPGSTIVLWNLCNICMYTRIQTWSLYSTLAPETKDVICKTWTDHSRS